MLNLNHLRIFYHSAKNLSHTLAARELFISQPGVSKQVKALQDHFGFPLFGRRSSQLYLTEEGKTLFEYTKVLFDAERKIELIVEEMKTLKRGTLRIGLPTAFLSFMSFLIDIFQQLHPDVSIQVIAGSSQSLVQDLVENRAELAVIGKVVDNQDVEFIHFAREEVLFVVSPQHALALKKYLTIEEIAREPIIVKAIGSGTRLSIDDAFSARGLHPNILLETSEIDSIKTLVEHKHVGAFLMQPEVVDDIEAGRFIAIPIKDGKIFVDIYLTFLRELKPSIPVVAFMDILEDLKVGTSYFPALAEGWPADLRASSLYDETET